MKRNTKNKSGPIYQAWIRAMIERSKERVNRVFRKSTGKFKRA